MTRNRITWLLARRGWTDTALAVRAGLDRSHVNHVKNRRSEPTVATALAIARAFGCSVADVFPTHATMRSPRFSRLSA